MTTATSRHETPAFIRAGDHDIFGVLTAPTVEANGVAVILLFGGLYTLSINRNRVSVEAARRFASLGYHVLRLDLHGVGESAGIVEIYDLAHPFFQDVVAAADWLEERGIHEVVLVGQCYGARTCLAAAEHLLRLRGVALFSMPVHDFTRTEFEAERNAKQSVWRLIRRALRLRVFRGLFSRARRARYREIARAKIRTMQGHGETDAREKVSKDVLRRLKLLVTRGTPVLWVYGNEDFRDVFERVRTPAIDDILARPRARIELRLVDHIKLHGLPSMDAQQVATEIVEEWLVGLSPIERDDAVQGVSS